MNLPVPDSVKRLVGECVMEHYAETKAKRPPPPEKMPYPVTNRPYGF